MSNVQILDNLIDWRDRLLAAQIDPADRLLWVDVDGQELHVCEAGEIIQQYPVSTALKGIGCEVDSFKTPVGLHQIAEKIGAGEPVGMLFRGRQVTGQLTEVEASTRDTGRDHISSRIMWLRGLEPGINLGDGVDSYDRYIYIHGTNEEGRIGQAVSHGCIRMKNIDVVELFDSVQEGTAVIISSSSTAHPGRA